MPSVRTASAPPTVPNSVASAIAIGVASHQGQPRLMLALPLRPNTADHVAGKAGDRQLHQADHAAIAGQEHQAQRDDAENQRSAENLDQEKTVGEQRHDDQDEADNPGGGIAEIRTSKTGQGRRCDGGVGLKPRILRNRHG